MYLLGMVTRVPARAVYVGLAFGVLAILWAYFCGQNSTFLPAIPRFPLHSLWIGIAGNLTVFVTGWLAGLAMKPVLPDAQARLSP
jgi:hypothetical protein